MTEIVDPKTFWTIIHLFGVAFGAGGAFVSDGMFFASIKDKTFSKIEITFLKLGSVFVWIGLSLLILSGIAMLVMNPERYLESTKFISKMIIVLFIFLNGIYFHSSHIPFIEKWSQVHFRDIPGLKKKREHLIISGSISVVSWSFAIILGALRGLPFSILEIILVYLVCVVGAIAFALLIQNKLLPHE